MRASATESIHDRASPAVLADPGRATRMGAALLLVTLTALWTWWALANGAFFETVSNPGYVALYAVLVVMVAFAPLRLRGGGAIEVATLSLIGLALWTVASIAWTPARDLALEDAQRTFLYAAAFGAGAWLTNALRRQMIASLAPLLVAGAVVCAVVAVIGLTTGSPDSLLDGEGTLSFPFGYRNATAGFLLMVGLAAFTLVARPASRPALRIGSGALAGAAFCFAAMGQSRGSLIGGFVGVVVLLLASRDRGRVAVALLCAAIPTALALPQLLDPFNAVSNGLPVLPELRGAVSAAILAALASGLLVAVATKLEPALAPRARRLTGTLPRGRLKLALLMAPFVAAVAVAGFLVISSRDDGLDGTNNSSEQIQGSRFTYTAGLNRTDFWRVAFDEFEQNPVLGDGAGGFRTRYLQEGRTLEAPRDAHSMPLEILGELGLPGLVLFLTAIGAGVTGAVRSRSLGPEAAALSSAALAVGACWFGQGAIDWSWSYAGLCAPAFALLGSASAPRALGSRDVRGRGGRIGLISALILLAAVAVPTYISARLTSVAASSWRSDPLRAERQLDLAAQLNPLTDTPLLIDAQIAILSNQSSRALASLKSARTRNPENWESYLLAAEALADKRPAQARTQLERAKTLYPESSAIPPLEQRLAAQPSGSPEG